MPSKKTLTTQPGLTEVPSYLSSLALLPDAKITIDLSNNENALGPPSEALLAYQKAQSTIHRYPDGTCLRLRQVIAERYHLDSQQIVCGAGSDELISLLVRIFCGKEDEIIFPQYGFIMYYINALRVGAKPVRVAQAGFQVHIDNIIAGLSSKTKLIFLDNPNNPTGTDIDIAQLKLLISRIPKQIVVVIDGAYAEYLGDEYCQFVIELVKNNSNVVLLRSFSKMHALAGLRLGWSYSSCEIADYLEKARNPYNVTLPAQYAGIAVMQNEAHVALGRAYAREWTEKIAMALRQIGVEVPLTKCNFLCADFKVQRKAEKAYQCFLEAGLLTRQLQSYYLPTCLRITVGTPQENQFLIQLIQKLKLTQ